MKEEHTMATIKDFHLAFPVKDLSSARAFYTGVIGCPEGRSTDHYVDFDFYGHQIVAHLAPERPTSESDFDGSDVTIPHFGLNLDWEAFHDLLGRLKKGGVRFVKEPHVRLEGKVGEHVSMFIHEPVFPLPWTPVWALPPLKGFHDMATAC